MAILKYYNTATSAWEYIAASTTANFTSWKKTMSGGETSVSGTDDNAVTLSYTVGLEQVFINGVLQVRGTDYTATNGTSVTGLSALVANDIVTVVCYAPFNVANTIAPTVVDAKGDLIAGTAADTVGRLAVGTNNQLLAADSSTATGLKWINAGLTLINTTSFSAVTSQSVNDVFSSTYENYLLLTRITDMSVGDNVQIRMRASGSDDSTANYHNLGLRITTTVDRIASYGQTSYRIGETGTKKGAFQTIVYGPQLAALTQFNGLITNGFNNPMENGFQMGAHNVATAYTGFTIFPASGTMTGSISVYGYNK